MLNYLLLVVPFVLLALWATSRVKRTFAHYSRVPLRSGISGAEAAQLILRAAGIHDVALGRAPGTLSDHYDPRHKTVRLSDEVLNGRNAAAVAVAAHEVGHAIQHAHAYQPMKWRDALVPVVNITNSLALPMFLLGLLFVPFRTFALIAVIIFAAATLFHLVTLPVEFDASRRAIGILEGSGFVATDEMVGVRKTLYAAGFTYLAATLVAAAELVHWLMMSGVLGGGNE